MKKIKVECPAKINLTLKILNKRDDGFHNIDSEMQTINLFDYLTVEIDYSKTINIELSGNTTEIPYDSKNLVYKAAELFFSKTNLTANVKCFIDKNIPIAAGLAGGSTDAAGMLFALNKLFNEPLSEHELHEHCAQLGSDLNVCLQGGLLQCEGRGEKITPLPFKEFELHLIKPMALGISAKEAYNAYSQKIKNSYDINTKNTFMNDLEWAIIDQHKELQYIKSKYPHSYMTGSGSTYFSLAHPFEHESDFWVANNLQTIGYGVREVKIY